MAIKLSILIATMPSRRKSFINLFEYLSWQLAQIPNCEVELMSDDSMQYNIGIKRNSLLYRAKGEYIVFADDDDQVSPDYVEKILKACETGADCIGINGTISFNGIGLKDWFISKEYGSWYENWQGYFRTPNHISPVRRELALQAGFPEIAFGEDAEYSRRLLPLLKTEIVIPEKLYHYDYYEK